MGSDPEMEIFDLSERIKATLAYLQKRMPSLGGNVKLINNIDEGIQIMANGTLISWAIENLIRNAIDSINNSNGKIVIDLDQDSFHVKVRISDDGCGIPKKDWKNIFRPGFSTKKSGWGLGLSLCQRIIKEVHKGKIYVLDSKINNGTVIELTIPNK
jgi:signal transduction histidine kinase